MIGKHRVYIVIISRLSRIEVMSAVRNYQKSYGSRHVL